MDRRRCIRCTYRYQLIGTDPKYPLLCKTCAAGQRNRDRIAEQTTEEEPDS